MKNFCVGDLVGQEIIVSAAFEGAPDRIKLKNLYRVVAVGINENPVKFYHGSMGDIRAKIENLGNPTRFHFLSTLEIENYWHLYKSREQQVAERLMV